MKKVSIVILLMTVASASAVGAQDGGGGAAATPSTTVMVANPVPASVAALQTLHQRQVILPADTVIQVTAVQEISSKGMHVGDAEILQVATDVAQDGVVVIPRGSPVKATVTWRTGKGIVGKSAKFELTFASVSIRGQDYALKGKHRQEGRGNTVAALLGSSIVTGHSAVIASGQGLTAFTAVPISID